MNLSVHLHPMLVHFPIALTVAAVVLSICAWKTGSATWLAAARLALIGAALGGVLSAAAGLWAEESGSHPASAHVLMDRHEGLGYWVAGLLVVVAWWGWKRSAKWIFWPSLIVMAMIFYQGYMGGQLVYVHGVGVARPAAVATDHRHSGTAGPESSGQTDFKPKGFGDGSIATH